MIECYCRECEFHCKNEPFCNIGNCVVTKEQVIEFQITRREYLMEVSRRYMVCK